MAADPSPAEQRVLLTGSAMIGSLIDKGFIEGGDGWTIKTDQIKSMLTGYGGPHADREEAVDVALALMEHMGPIEDERHREGIKRLLENEHDALCERPVG